MRALKGGLLLVVLAGWLVPMWLGFAALFDGLGLTMGFRLSGEAPLNSFPFLAFARLMLLLAGAWLSLVVVALSVLFVARAPGFHWGKGNPPGR